MISTEDEDLNNLLNFAAIAGVPISTTVKQVKELGYTKVTEPEIRTDRVARLQFFTRRSELTFH